MESSFPKKINTYFIQALTTKFPNLNIESKRKNGYSVYIDGFRQRWIMVDMNDATKVPHLFICINCYPEEFLEVECANRTKLPTSEESSQSRIWLNTNKDAIHFKLCEDKYQSYDFRNNDFLDFIGDLYNSFIRYQSIKPIVRKR
ncbi:hypothetical protein [Ectobacillus funiculus]|uniref:hypothetical protein n=1 Tax=Ectobacillus funiculus TaxID=137993 RepID=UPI00101C48AE|nr:hypothetical protein [Ectobacillus funiculus]